MIIVKSKTEKRQILIPGAVGCVLLLALSALFVLRGTSVAGADASDPGHVVPPEGGVSAKDMQSVSEYIAGIKYDGVFADQEKRAYVTECLAR
jgi:hypothetical protein